jgi:hypothetical protein
MAKNKKLAYSVTLWNAESGQYDTFLPGSELPAWAAGAVKNPRAFQLEESQPVAGTEDMPIPGPSQLPYHNEKDLVTQNRMQTGSAVPRGSGEPMKRPTDVHDRTVNPQPNLHDEVAKAANRAVWTTEAREEAFKLRTGAVASDQDLRNAANMVEDAEMNVKAEEQQAEIAAQLAADAYEQAMAIQAQAAVQSATAFASVPGAEEHMEAKKAAAVKAPAKKAAAKDDSDK